MNAFTTISQIWYTFCQAIWRNRLALRSHCIHPYLPLKDRIEILRRSQDKLAYVDSSIDAQKVGHYQNLRHPNLSSYPQFYSPGWVMSSQPITSLSREAQLLTLSSPSSMLQSVMSFLGQWRTKRRCLFTIYTLSLTPAIDVELIVSHSIPTPSVRGQENGTNNWFHVVGKSPSKPMHHGKLDGKTQVGMQAGSMNKLTHPRLEFAFQIFHGTVCKALKPTMDSLGKQINF